MKKYIIFGVLFAMLIGTGLAENVAHGSSMGGGASISTTSSTSSGILIADADGATASGSGVGDFSGNWWVANTAGLYANVGMDIRKSESYDYVYTLDPGQGGGWSDPEVSAGETLDVVNAKKISAYASARDTQSPNAPSAFVDTEISDPGNKASLLGYTNNAMINANEVTANQNANSMTGITSIEALATDKTGKSAHSQANFIGTYSGQQLVDIWPDDVFAFQDLKGLGFFKGATTSAKDEAGHVAAVTTGTFSGMMHANRQEAEVGAFDPNYRNGQVAHAILDIGIEYSPFSYPKVGKWYQKIQGNFGTQVNYGNAASAITDKMSCGELFEATQESAIGCPPDLSPDELSAELNQNSNSIGAVDAIVLTRDDKGNQVKSEVNYIGELYDERFLKANAENAYLKQALKGVGYFGGETTSAKCGNNEAIAKQTGSFLGNMVTNEQQLDVDPTSSIASQAAEFLAGTYGGGLITFNTLAKANGKVNSLTEFKWGKQIEGAWQVSAP